VTKRKFTYSNGGVFGDNLTTNKNLNSHILYMFLFYSEYINTSLLLYGWLLEVNNTFNTI